MINRWLKLFLKGEWSTIVAEDVQKGEVTVSQDDKTEEPLAEESVAEHRSTISEPILTAVALFKKSPKDFRIQTVYGNFNGTVYRVEHAPTSVMAEVYEYIETRTKHTGTTCDIYKDKWYKVEVDHVILTHDEHELLVATFRDYFEKRAQRYSEILTIRQKAKDRRERLRITALLQGELLLAI